MALVLGVGALMTGLVPGVAFSDYREMRDQFREYEPPAHLMSEGGMDRVNGMGPWEVMEGAALEMKSGSVGSVGLVRGGNPLLSSDPERRERLSGAATDAGGAAGVLAGNFSLGDLEALTALRSPAIMAAEKRARAAREAFDQVGALDALLRRYTALTEGVMTGVGPMKGTEPVEMRFPFPGVFSLKSGIAEQVERAALETLAAAGRDAVTEARKAYWDLVFVDQARSITGRTHSLLGRLEDVADTRYGSGAMGYGDAVKVRIRRASLGQDLITLDNRRRNVEARIRELTDLPPGSAVGRPKAAAPDGDAPGPDDLIPLALTHRQELRRMRENIARMEKMVAMAETMILPDFSQGLSLYSDAAVAQVGGGAMRDAFATGVEAGMGAGAPKKPLYGLQDAYLRETKMKLLAARQDLVAAEAATRTLVRGAWFALDTARREAALYGNTVAPLSRAALETANRGYEAGGVSFAEMIAAHMDWLNAGLTLYRKRADMGAARAELARALGTEIPK